MNESFESALSELIYKWRDRGASYDDIISGLEIMMDVMREEESAEEQP